MFFLVLKVIPLDTTDSYAVLVVDASYSDRFIGDLLSSDITKGYISESTQWVFLDDFGVLQRIPLDEYQDRVEIFDPRNDGYAEKLQSFFVRDGKRLFFIPFLEAPRDTWFKKTGFGILGFEKMRFSDAWINKKRIKNIEVSIAASLKDTVKGDIPFSIEFFGQEKPLLFYILLFIVAVAVTLILSETPLFVAVMAPVLGSLALIGPLGFALCTVLVALSGVFMEPIRELLAFRRYQHEQPFTISRLVSLIKRLGSLNNLFPTLLVPLCRVILFLGILGLCAILSVQRFPPRGGPHFFEKNGLVNLGGAGFLCIICLLGLVLWIKSNQGKTQDHIRFIQVPIMIPAKPVIINRSIIPFALVSLMALYIPQMSKEMYAYHIPDRIADSRYLIDPLEYEKHAAFQASFSFIPLGTEGELSQFSKDRAYAHKHYGTEASYVQYTLGEDGLIVDTKTNIGSDYEAYTHKDIPPFPLENLIAFLNNFRHNYADDTNQILIINKLGIVPMLLVPGVYIMVIFGLTQTRGKKKHILVYNDKRIAA